MDARVEVVCAGGKKRTLFAEKRIGLSGAPSVYEAPGVAFVEWSVSWAFEGERGRATDAAFIDLVGEACAG